MFGPSYRIARVWGIPIKVHISLVILVAVYVVSVLSEEVRAGAPLYLRMAVVMGFVVLFFASVAVHELAHSFVAMRKGCRVREITLSCIGGVAQMERIPTKPSDEILMAIMGPATSAVIGVVGLSAGRLLEKRGLFFPAVVFGGVGMLNLILAGFNLLPAFPMDGGRVLRALLARRMGRLRATYIAARLGRMIAVIFGIAAVLAPFVPAIGVGFWPLILIAFFVYTAAGREYRMVRMQEMQGARTWGFWRPFRGRVERDDDAPTVVISPPPYKDGPPTETKAEVGDGEDPLDLFGRG